MDDYDLNRLLREWTAPSAPPDLRPRRALESPRRWLVTGAIRVPVPVALAALLLVALSIASTRIGPVSAPETSGPRRSGELARYALTGPLEGFDAVLVELSFQPGVSVPEHRHPGSILGYVVDGQMRTAINTSRTRSCRRAVRSSNRTARFTRRSVPRPGCARARPGIPGGSQRQPADGARDDRERTMKLRSRTRSTWNAYGLCLEGPLKGTQLKQVHRVEKRDRDYSEPSDIPWNRGGLAAAGWHRRTNIRATAPSRTGETRVDGPSRRVRGGARGIEHPARVAQFRPRAPSSGARPRLRRGGADAFCHQQRAGTSPACRQDVLRAVWRRSYHGRFGEA